MNKYPELKGRKPAVDPDLHIPKNVAGGAAGTLLGGLVGGPVGAVIGGVLGVAFGRAFAKVPIRPANAAKKPRARIPKRPAAEGKLKVKPNRKPNEKSGADQAKVQST